MTEDAAESLLDSTDDRLTLAQKRSATRGIDPTDDNGEEYRVFYNFAVGSRLRMEVRFERLDEWEALVPFIKDPSTREVGRIVDALPPGGAWDVRIQPVAS